MYTPARYLPTTRFYTLDNAGTPILYRQIGAKSVLQDNDLHIPAIRYMESMFSKEGNGNDVQLDFSGLSMDAVYSPHMAPDRFYPRCVDIDCLSVAAGNCRVTPGVPVLV
jgi:hypothetical protein